MQLCVMILCIIENNFHLSSRVAAYGPEVAHKEKKAFGIKLLGTVEQKLAVAQADRPEIADAFACRVVTDNRLFHFTMNPHATP